MDNRTIEQAAAQALLDRGVGFRIPAPLLFRIFGKKTIRLNVKRMRLGSMLELSELASLTELERVKVGDERENMLAAIDAEPLSVKYQFIAENKNKVAYLVGCCLLNSRRKIGLFGKRFGRYLANACTADELQELALWLFAYGRPEAFTNTTKLMRAMILTMPRNLGQTTQRS